MTEAEEAAQYLLAYGEFDPHEVTEALSWWFGKGAHHCKKWTCRAQHEGSFAERVYFKSFGEWHVGGYCALCGDHNSGPIRDLLSYVAEARLNE